MRYTYIFFFFLVFFNTYSQVSNEKVVPKEILLKKSTKHNYSISPNGKYFIEVIDTNIDSDLYVVDIDNYELMHKIPFGTKVIDKVYWLTNNRLLYESMGAIYAIDLDGSNSMQIVDRVADKLAKDWRRQYQNIQFNRLISLMPNKEHQILIETFDFHLYASIKEVNIFTGEKYTVMNGEKYKVNSWVLDAYGEVKFAIRYKDYGVDYFLYNKEKDKLEPFSVKINNIYYPLRIDAKSYLNQDITFESFGYKQDIIYITSNIGTDKRKLLTYNFKEEKVINIIAEDINCDIKEVDGSGIQFIYDFVEEELAGVHYLGILPQYKWYSDKYRQYHKAIKEKYPNYFNEIIDSDYSCERLLIHQWSGDNTGNVGVYNTKDNTYSVMFWFNEELTKYKLSKTKSLIAKTRDDYKIPCYFNLPVNASPEKMPLVVIPHGGPWARDYWEVEKLSQYFATRGYATLRINYRGSTGFGKSHVLAGVNSIDNIMINDIADATTFVSEQFNIDKNKVFIFGHSYGGYATYMSLLKYPEIYASGVAISAPTDIRKWMKTQKENNNHFAVEFWNTALDNNNSKKYLNKISPISYTKEFQKPLLVFHGKQDKTVLVSHAEEMVKKLKKDKKDVQIEILQSEGHSIYDSNTLGYLLDRSNRFFKKTVSEK